MTKPDPNQVSALLDDVRRGDRNAIDQLIAVVYPELRGIAGHFM